jgi:hypothetical protein
VGLPTVTDHDGWRISTVAHLIGEVSALRGDTLFVDVGGSSPTPVALSRVSTIEVSHGTKSNVGKGALIGGLVGAALGGAAATAACGGIVMGQEVSCSGGEIVGGVVVGGLIVGAVGATIGALIRTEGWEQIPLSGLRVQPSPVTGDGLAISAALRL